MSISPSARPLMPGHRSAELPGSSSTLRPAIWYRRTLTPSDEVEALTRHFPASPSMVGIEGSLVVARYAALPFYHEVVQGLGLQGSRLVNSILQHQYIANFDYYHDIADLTPRTWFRIQDVPQQGGPYVVKGVTNSKKHEWATKMYAPSFADVVRIASDLAADLYLGSQDVIVRAYEPLRVLQEGLNGLPFANEHRCFFWRDQLLAAGFYWSEAEVMGALPPEGLAVAQAAAVRLAAHTTFFTVDVAETADGRWIVIEVNDGQMAGLSCIAPEPFYAALAEAMQREVAAPRPSR